MPEALNNQPSLIARLRASSFVGFAAVGFLSTIIDIALLKLGVYLAFPLPLSTAVGFLAGLTNGYLLNSRFVFAKDRSSARYAKYFLVSLGGLIITELIVNLLHEHADLSVLMAKLVAVVVVFFWNYGLSRAWVFK